ncbi:hypothetical protein [Phenylobacterium sp.]|uniref:hypothetical protein n=1 Tax=Phenylobacterium sp. TaxID=1871053 RepID=UPI002DEB9212|nr:hypothetical protein [Phenylobacterium sp.]
MDPFTIAAGISAVGSLFKGLTGFFGGNTRAKAEQAAAQQAGQEAGVATSQALQQGESAAADAAVQGAANGGGLVGSTLGVIQDVANRSMFNARAAAYRGLTEERAHLYQAGVAKTQGLQDLIGSGIQAAGSLAGGFARSSLLAKQTTALKTLKGDAGYDPLMGIN